MPSEIKISPEQKLNSVCCPWELCWQGPDKGNTCDSGMSSKETLLTQEAVVHLAVSVSIHKRTGKRCSLLGWAAVQPPFHQPGFRKKSSLFTQLPVPGVGPATCCILRNSSLKYRLGNVRLVHPQFPDLLLQWSRRNGMRKQSRSNKCQGCSEQSNYFRSTMTGSKHPGRQVEERKARMRPECGENADEHLLFHPNCHLWDQHFILKIPFIPYAQCSRCNRSCIHITSQKFLLLSLYKGPCYPFI